MVRINKHQRANQVGVFGEVLGTSFSMALPISRRHTNLICPSTCIVGHPEILLSCVMACSGQAKLIGVYIFLTMPIHIQLSCVMSRYGQAKQIDAMFFDANRCKIITIMRAIWTSQNRWTHDEKGYDLVQAIKLARDDLALLELPKDQHNIPAGQCWRPQGPGWVKINTDGVIDAHAQLGGGGCFARSYLSFLDAWSNLLPDVIDPFIVKVLAL